MATYRSKPEVMKPRESVIAWLLDSDPSIRWQVMRDLTREPDAVVAAERARVAVEGWGARVLELQRPEGYWGDEADVGLWMKTTHTLALLKDLGLDPASEQARRSIGLLREHLTWWRYQPDGPFFDGESEACINGRILAAGAYFGAPSERLLERVLDEQLEDGGWNCDAPPSRRSSLHSTICVVEGLLEYEKAKGAIPTVTEARVRAQEYFLERHMFRSLSTGKVIDPDWKHFSFPPTWHYDVLRGLDYLRDAGVKPEERVAEAVELIVEKQDQDGRWPFENPHPDRVHFDMEGPAGTASRWNTLRALRVLDWYAASG